MAQYPRRRTPPPFEHIGTLRRRPSSSLVSTLLDQYNFSPYREILPAEITEKVDQHDFLRPLIVYYDAYSLDFSYPLPEEIKIDNLLEKYPKNQYYLCLKFYRHIGEMPKSKISLFDVSQNELPSYYYCLDGEAEIVTINLQYIEKNLYSITYKGSFNFQGQYDRDRDLIIIDWYTHNPNSSGFTIEDAFTQDVELFTYTSFKEFPTIQIEDD